MNPQIQSLLAAQSQPTTPAPVTTQATVQPVTQTPAAAPAWSAPGNWGYVTPTYTPSVQQPYSLNQDGQITGDGWSINQDGTPVWTDPSAPIGGSRMADVFGAQGNISKISALDRAWWDQQGLGGHTWTPQDIQTFTGGSQNKGVDVSEFNLLPADVQAAALADPELFLSSIMKYRNPANNDLLSVGAEGGFGNYSTAKWDPVRGLVPDSSQYMTVHDESGLGGLGSALGLAAMFIPGLQPFAVGLNAANAVASGNPLGALVSLAGLPGGPLSSMSSAISNSVGGGMLGSALGGAATSGLTSALTGGDILQGALAGGAGGAASNGIGGALADSGLSPEVIKAFSGAGSTLAKDLVTGTDPTLNQFLLPGLTALNGLAGNPVGSVMDSAKNLLTPSSDPFAGATSTPVASVSSTDPLADLPSIPSFDNSGVTQSAIDNFYGGEATPNDQGAAPMDLIDSFTTGAPTDTWSPAELQGIFSTGLSTNDLLSQSFNNDVLAADPTGMNTASQNYLSSGLTPDQIASTWNSNGSTNNGQPWDAASVDAALNNSVFDTYGGTGATTQNSSGSGGALAAISKLLGGLGSTGAGGSGASGILGILGLINGFMNRNKDNNYSNQALQNARNPSFNVGLTPKSYGIPKATPLSSIMAPGAAKLARGGRPGALSQMRSADTIPGGQSDNIPAALSPGEYVMDADVVSALGDGDNNAGAAKLDKMRQNIRTHKRSAPPTKIPPKAKSPEAYLGRK